MLAALAMLVAVTGPVAVGAPAPAGGTHIGYVDNFVTNTESVPSNFITVAGPANAWRVAGNTLQAVQFASTQITLSVPDLPIDNVGGQLLGLCINPEQTVNSGFYTGFHVNEAPLIELNLGSLLDSLLKIRINVPLQNLQVLDAVGTLLATINLPKPVQFNQWTCLNLLVLADLNQLLVILGNTLDTIGHVLDGKVTQVIQMDSSVALPRGTFSLLQPAGNTGRILFKEVHLQTTPDMPLDIQAFAGPGDGQVTLKWDAPAADGGSYITAFNIYRGLSPDFADMELVGTLEGGFETEFTDQAYTGLVPTSQKFYYRVTAENYVGEGPLALAACGIPYPMGLLLLENSGFGCGTHGLVEAPLLEPFLP